MRLRPFFLYYGAKWRLAPKYPYPKCKAIIEPFAGAAGYSLLYPDRDVILFDINPIVYGVWSYLINCSVSDINRLPSYIEDIRDVNCSQEEKWLMGFWVNNGVASPRNVMSKWGRGEKGKGGLFWGDTVKERIKSQKHKIKHWKVFNASYDSCPNVIATWFIDPPYNNKAGSFYAHKFSDYESLSVWCQDRETQSIVCENYGANWLPFVPFVTSKSTFSDRVSKEVIWTKGCEQQKELFS